MVVTGQASIHYPLYARTKDAIRDRELSKDVDIDDLQAKISAAKRNAWVYFSVAVATALVLSLDFYLSFAVILHAITAILCVALGFQNVSRYRTLRDQIEQA